MPEQLQLTLPYEVITTPIAARAYHRDNFGVGSKVSYTIPFNKILLRPGSNHRKIFLNIPELAQSLLTHGQKDPFDLWVLKDGRYFLKEGERRYRAYQLLIQEGKFPADGLVEFFPVKTDMTEFKALIEQYAINNFKDQFKPIENAGVAFDLKYNFGEEKTNEEIAEVLNVSRQTVDNLIELAKLPDDLKDQIYKEQITATHALSIQRSKKKLEKQAAKEEEKQAQSNMYVQPGYQDPLKDEMEGLDALNLQADRQQQADKEKERREAERLERDAVLVPVKIEAMAEHLGKRLAADAIKYWDDAAIDPAEHDGATSIKRPEVVLKQGEVIEEDTIEKLIHENVEQVYIFKEVQVAPSVVTEAVAEPEKSIYDSDRPEVAAIQNAIKLGDRILTQIEKSDLPEGLKKDITDWSAWQMKSMLEAREFIHKNKRQNKRDR